MARIFVTGSADGLGQLASKELADQGHQVMLHARNEKRGQEALAAVPDAEGVMTADLSSVDETKDLAEKANRSGRFDVVIHNAAVYHMSGDNILTVNVLAPYILTCLMERPRRLIYMSSGMHRDGRSKLESLKTDLDSITYSDSKLHVLMLSKAVARKWPEVYVNAVDPGWVPTKMGGKAAPDSIEKGYETQVWLAVSEDPEVTVSGRYMYHKRKKDHNPEAGDIAQQDRLLSLCEEMTGVSLPTDSK
jgi:NAD(P)-dependent dehydrogenase (short-subunit alcohol dehydrogenase family)